MKTIQFIFGIHNHQPVGNFDHVMEDAYRTSYRPFLEMLERHPGIRMAIHNTGILLDWYQERHPDYIPRLRALAECNQVEILMGGYYEPIISSIPDADKIGQIQMMRQAVKRLFNVEAHGMWMAERVWEPQLPRPMRQAGVDFTILDSSHFLSAGLRANETLGYFLTEDSGYTLGVFPISEDLRHAIPYRPVDEIIEYLQSIATQDGTRIAVMADDGEKYGVWPGSYKHCYEDGWLDRFFAAIEENSEWIRMRHFYEALYEAPPLGRIYLPTASYSEMMEWALPTEAEERYEDFVESLKASRPNFNDEHVFVRGGFWRNFLAKYPEANNMHKRMIRVSRKVHAALEKRPRSKKLLEARDRLWQGQCNCAYWHGVFGGLYAAHLRSAVYRKLIEADGLINEAAHTKKRWVEIDYEDFDCDGHKEIVITTPAQIVFLKPNHGGMLVEHDHVGARFNLVDVLARRKEAYHRKLTAVGRSGEVEEGEPKSIHDCLVVKEAGLERLLHYDWYRRGTFLDHFIAPHASLEEFAEARHHEFGDFVNQPYIATEEKDTSTARLMLVRRGSLWLPEGVLPVRVEKVMTAAADAVRIEAAYRVSNEANLPLHARFGVEFTVNFLAADSHDRYYRIDGLKTDPPQLGSMGGHGEVREFGAVDEWLQLELRVTADPPLDVWRFPIYTVSISEAGFERVYQGSVLFANTLLALAPGETKTFNFRYEALPWA